MRWHSALKQLYTERRLIFFLNLAVGRVTRVDPYYLEVDSCFECLAIRVGYKQVATVCIMAPVHELHAS